MTEEMTTISVVLESDEYDQDLLDTIGQQLYNELREEYGPAVQHQPLEEIPDGSKGTVDMTIALSSLVISVAASHREISKFFKLLADCLTHWGDRCSERITIDGHEVVLRGMSKEAVEKLVCTWKQSKAY